MTAAHWSAVDGETEDILTLVADVEHPSANYEWDQFLAALDVAADASGVIDPNVLRPLLRGVVAPPRIGAFVHRALKLGLIAYTGRWVVSDDTASGNAGKPSRELRRLA